MQSRRIHYAPNHDKRQERGRTVALLIAAVLFSALVWFAGGASRSDQSGQLVVRAAAWAVCIGAIFLFRREDVLSSVRSARSLWLFAALVAALTALQLLPLAPQVWTALPGREIVAQTAVVAGFEQPWRPLSLSPGGTVNALSSLIVPFAALLLFTQASLQQHRHFLTAVLAAVLLCVLVGLLQFTGARFDNPFINDGLGEVAGIFANRNHFALFAAFGCVLGPVWGFAQERGPRWRALLGVAFMLCCALLILASGSRAGLALGGTGMVLGLLAVRRRIADHVRSLPKGVSLIVIGFTVTAVIGFLVLAFVMGRAVSVDRAMALASADDLRARALPTVWAMAQLYFPFGSGLGTFDPVYRIHEPMHLLQPSYLNHAHNDWLEVLLELGLAGVVLLAAALVWWAYKSLAAWRSRGSSALLQRAGSAMILMTMLASVVDYPARTPLIMVVLVIAAIWLNTASFSASRRPAPSTPHGG